jgi:Kdo2-lipid IVA lauroyltransferase/acyltransferase
VDLLLYLIFRAFIGFLNLLPHRVRLEAATALVRVFLAFSGRYRDIADKNLRQAFPERDLRWRREILRRSCRSLAEVVIDFIRLPRLGRAWVQSHVDFPGFERFCELRRQNQGKGVLLVSGHLGSFELLPFFMAHLVAPMAFVVRNFHQRRIDAWWNGVRCRPGNRVIGRKGAIKDILRFINGGMDVGLLFDQNVVRSQAYFVDWFGRPAATTRAVAAAALRTQTAVLLFAVRTVSLDHYHVEMREFDFKSLYQDESLSAQEKGEEITRQVTREFEILIRQDPPSWFWLHRRWKTVPAGMEEDFYK